MRTTTPTDRLINGTDTGSSGTLTTGAAPIPPPFPFERFRRLHFGPTHRPPRCLHCSHPQPQRWGRFSGRQRYRCTACRRTFSDFTGTPLAHLKRIDPWAQFGRCVLASLTVRRTAAALGVHPSTAFRWRHRLLSALDASDTARLVSPVTIHETWFPFSEKGKRDLDRPPRRHSVFGRLDIPKAWLYYAGDGVGRTTSGLVGPRRPTVEDLTTAFDPRLGAASVVASAIGPWGAAGLMAERTGRPYRRMDWHAPEFEVVDRSILAMRRWLPRFHGVASRYLQNYAVWHRFLEDARRLAAGRPVPSSPGRMAPVASAAPLAAQAPASLSASPPASPSAPSEITACRLAGPLHWLLAAVFP